MAKKRTSLKLDPEDDLEIAQAATLPPAPVPPPVADPVPAPLPLPGCRAVTLREARELKGGRS